MAEKIEAHKFRAMFGQDESHGNPMCDICGARLHSVVHNPKKGTKIKGTAKPDKLG